MRNHHPALYQEIERRTIKLNKYKSGRNKNGKQLDISIFERLYCLENGIDDRPLCIECKTNRVMAFMPYKNMYAQYCCHECQRHSSIQVERGLKTKIKKYGKGNSTNNKKARVTRLSKYGSYHPNDFSSKVKATKKKNHGDENYVNAEKMKSTVEKHKLQNPNYYYDREQKSKQTKVRNGHDPNWNNRDKFKDTLSQFSDERKAEIKQKRKETCIESYGYEFATQNESVKSKTKQTCMSVYGVQCTLNTAKAQASMSIAVREKAWEQLKLREMDVIPLFEKNQFVLENNNSREWSWKCKKCGYEFMHVWKGINSHCPKCYKHNFMGIQNEIVGFVKSICNDDLIRENDRKTFSNAIEIDVLNATKMIGIEINGLIWHNVDKAVYDNNRISKQYHSDKTSLCLSRGIRLIHIFEDEWLEHKKLCMSKLKKILCPEKMMKIDAHSCIICKDMPCNDKEKYLVKYTFYGCDGSSVVYSLKLHGKVVAMMTFAKTKTDKAHKWQVLNYIEINSFIIEDGFNVLLDEFCKDFSTSSVCYYLSRDWNVPEDVEGGHMKFIKLDDPRMYWSKKQMRFKESSFNRKDIESFLDVVDHSKTFVQNMNDNQFYRIYDSGTMIFEAQSK